MRIVFILSFIFLIFPVFAADDSAKKSEKKEAKWEFVSEDNGLKLYEREHEGSDIKEVRATVTYQGTIQEAVDIMFDRLKHPEIFKYISYSDVLKKNDRCDWSYNRISAPVATDRDYYVKSCRVDNKDGSVSITWVPFDDPKYPVTDKFVRVKENKGFYKFTQVEPDKIKVDYYIYNDPGGSLPVFVKNIASRQAVPDTLWTLHKEIMKRRAASKK
ncbi:hypothetical protein IJG44_00345 [bacterium]|nr:hypothetical protein [bacterium]MBQ4437855.1 hypothetical protein [bacterium]